MKKVLITGATGNIGQELIQALYDYPVSVHLIAGVRNIDKASQQFSQYPNLDYRLFDFEDVTTFDEALKGVDTVFLLRPPHIADIPTYFAPLINSIKTAGIQEVVFLSVQGVELSKVIPHNKIETLIKAANIPFIFVRPSYFMQNITTTLYADIQQKRKIILPAGKARFNWIDIKNIAEATAVLIHRFGEYQGQAIEITGEENKSFGEVVDLINQIIPNKLVYWDVNPIRFYFLKKKEGLPVGLIMVMIMLHFLPRFQKEPRISTSYMELTSKKTTSIQQFIERVYDKINKC